MLHRDNQWNILILFLIVVIGIILVRHIRTWISFYNTSELEAFENSRLPPGVKRMLTIYKVSWCPHCQRLKQPVDKLEELIRAQPLASSRLEVVDCEEDPRACREAGVRSYPTLHLEEEGRAEPIVVPKTVDRENPRELYSLLLKGLPA